MWSNYLSHEWSWLFDHDNKVGRAEYLQYNGRRPELLQQKQRPGLPTYLSEQFLSLIPPHHQY